MNYIMHIAKAIDFIEDNLKQDIDIAACAAVSGYSMYHSSSELLKSSIISFLQNTKQL